MNTIIEKIRAEIERRANGEQVYNSEDAEFGYKSCARELLSILSDLEKEEKPSEGLEEEIVKVCEDFVFPLYGLDDEFGRELINKIARHFAKWGRGQMMDEWLKDRDGCFWDGVEEGKKAMREQMMKEAVEGTINNFPYPTIIELNKRIPTKEWYGEKVRIIIVKEDKQ